MRRVPVAMRDFPVVSCVVRAWKLSGEDAPASPQDGGAEGALLLACARVCAWPVTS